MNLDDLTIVAVGGEKFIGVKDSGPTDGPIILTNARRFLLNVQVKNNSAGELSALQVGGAILPIDICGGAMPKLVISHPDYYYAVAENPSIKDKIQRLMAAAEDIEMKMRAENSGIILR